MNEEELFRLKGITTQGMATLGTIELTFYSFTIEFHLVPDTFPIYEDGLIGNQALRKYNAQINYKINFVKINSHYARYYL